MGRHKWHDLPKPPQDALDRARRELDAADAAPTAKRDIREGLFYVRPVGRGVLFFDDPDSYADLYVDDWIEGLVGDSCCWAKLRISVEVLDGPWKERPE